jgi:hypothetical protein
MNMMMTMLEKQYNATKIKSTEILHSHIKELYQIGKAMGESEQ